MNVALWVVAGLLAALFLAAGAAKITQPKDNLAKNMAWVEDFSQVQVRGIGTLEVLGAVGLILPGLLDIAPILVPCAAVGFALLMVGAVVTHVRRGETQLIVVNVVIFALAVFVAWGRFGPYAFNS